MSAEIVVSAITLLGSVVAATIAWIQATKTARISAQSQVTFEQMKIDHDRRVKAFEATSAEVEPVERAIATAWEQLQQAKEAISRVLLDKGDKEAASLVLLSLSSNITDGYAAFGVHLPSAAQTAWHRAKKVVAMSSSLAGSAAVSNDDDNARKALSALREAMTDVQSILSSERVTLRMSAVDRVTKIL